MIKVSDYIMNFVASLGVKTVFMLPGGGCMHLVDSLGKKQDLEFVSCLHDQSAAIAADAYSQYTDNIGVCLVTTGPGGTNAITGVTASWIDSIPVLVISGQVKRADLIGDSGVRQRGPQEVNIVPIVDSITKYAVTVMTPEDIRYHLEKAIFKAKNGRPGPVWIDVPLDVQGAVIDESSLQGYSAPDAQDEDIRSQITETISLINQSERPVILAGNGIRLSGSIEPFKKLVKLLNIPVLTTWKAIDLLEENHPLFLEGPAASANVEQILSSKIPT